MTLVGARMYRQPLYAQLYTQPGKVHHVRVITLARIAQQGNLIQVNTECSTHSAIISLRREELWRVCLPRSALRIRTAALGASGKALKIPRGSATILPTTFSPSITLPNTA